jgi:2-methylcitrate dehydratase PrpD
MMKIQTPKRDSMEKTIAERFAEFGASISYEEIPSAVVEKTKELILDTVGISISSSTMDFGRAVLEMVARWGGARESSLVGSKTKVPCQNAAFANGVLGHGQDYDDTHTESVVHPSACLVPVALAMGERVDASGKEVLSALATGLEVMIHIGMPALNRFHLRGFHTTSICGTFAAALVAAKLSGFDKKKMSDALGISGSFTSGLLECIPSGSSAKRLHAGWAGLCGIVAADLADKGYTGPDTVFEGRLGVYNSFLRSEVLDLNAIFKNMGSEWEILNVRPKLYPCCHYLQSFLDCVSALRKETSFKPEDIAGIECNVPAGAVNIVCEPWPSKISPKTSYDGRFSLPFAVSLMAVRGKAGVEEFSEKYLSDPDIQRVMTRVRYQVESGFQVKDMPGWVVVTLKSGDRISHRIDRVRGDATHPISRDELLEKFSQNTALLNPKKRDKIAKWILALESQEKVSDAVKSYRML